MSAAPILARLEALPRARQVRPGAWAARCPAHEDTNPSLTWTENATGVGMKCFGGCEPEAIVAALDMTMADLFTPKPANGAAYPVTIATTRYPIQDAVGAVQAIHERYDRADGSKSFAWCRPDGQKGLGGRSEKTLPLYRSETLAAHDMTTPVIVVEGEKAADALASIWPGPVLATAIGAAAIPDPAVLACLAGRPVALWADNDDAGRKLMDALATVIGTSAASVARLDVPNLPPKGDAADYVAAGRTTDELLGLLRTAHKAHEVAYPEVWLSEVADVPPGAMLADGLMVPEGVTVLYGPGGTGKGHIACEAICQLVADAPVLILDYEAHRSEWRHRLGLLLTPEDLAMVAYWTPTKPLVHAVDEVRDIVARTKAAAIVLDSYVMAGADGRRDDPSDATRELFRALGLIGLPALVLAHVTKAGGEHQANPYGSVFITNLARMTISAEKRSTDGPLAVELRYRKVNDRDPELPRTYTFAYGERMTVTRSVEMTTSDLIDFVLDRPMSPAVVYSVLQEQGRLRPGMTVEKIGGLLRDGVGRRFARTGRGEYTRASTAVFQNEAQSGPL